MSKSASPPAGIATSPPKHLSAEEAAALILLTPRRLQQLVQDRWIEKSERGRYPLAGTVQGYIRFLQDEARRSSRTESASRVQDARAREIELRLAREEGRLVPIDEAIAALDVIIGPLLAELAGVPAEVTDDIEVRRRFEDATDRTLNALADRLVKAGNALRAGGDPAAELGVAEPSAEVP